MCFCGSVFHGLPPIEVFIQRKYQQSPISVPAPYRSQRAGLQYRFLTEDRVLKEYSPPVPDGRQTPTAPQSSQIEESSSQPSTHSQCTCYERQHLDHTQVLRTGHDGVIIPSISCRNCSSKGSCASDTKTEETYDGDIGVDQELEFDFEVPPLSPAMVQLAGAGEALRRARALHLAPDTELFGVLEPTKHIADQQPKQHSTSGPPSSETQQLSTQTTTAHNIEEGGSEQQPTQTERALPRSDQADANFEAQARSNPPVLLETAQVGADTEQTHRTHSPSRRSANVVVATTSQASPMGTVAESVDARSPHQSPREQPREQLQSTQRGSKCQPFDLDALDMVGSAPSLSAFTSKSAPHPSLEFDLLFYSDQAPVSDLDRQQRQQSSTVPQPEASLSPLPPSPLSSSGDREEEHGEEVKVSSPQHDDADDANDNDNDSGTLSAQSEQDLAHVNVQDFNSGTHPLRTKPKSPTPSIKSDNLLLDYHPVSSPTRQLQSMSLADFDTLYHQSTPFEDLTLASLDSNAALASLWAAQTPQVATLEHSDRHTPPPASSGSRSDAGHGTLVLK
eukprot:m.316236 g.316236  ORF g.316236 m.316236 type:complete len:564 (+) comp15981_c0_seq1:412-2103(+)